MCTLRLQKIKQNKRKNVITKTKMENQMNRRKWIKASAFLAGGVAFFSGSFNGLAARELSDSIAAGSVDFVTDEQVLQNAPAEIKARLSANENPFGPSPKAKKAIMDSIDSSYRYSFNAKELIGKIAAFEGIDPAMITLSAGSSPFLLAGAMHFTKDNGSIVTGDPSYDAMPASAIAMGGKVIKVPLTADYKLDLKAMEKAVEPSTKLVYICNPNNPTATLLDTAELKAFCDRVSAKIPVFVDEAYIDYVKDPQKVTVLDLVKQGKNIIVLRTFSKLYGFAGLRVGYMIAQPEMVKTLSGYAEGAFSISALSMQAALASYQDREFMEEVIAKTQVSKDFLYAALKKEGYDYIPSEANFVMFPIKMDGPKFALEMGKRGVSIRHWKFIGKDWCRVSIGTLDEMKTFADAFSQIA